MPEIRNLDSAHVGTDIPRHPRNIVMLPTLYFLRVKTIPTGQHESFEHVFFSLTWISRKFLRGHLTQSCSKLNMVNHEVPMIEPPKRKVRPVGIGRISRYCPSARGRFPLFSSPTNVGHHNPPLRGPLSSLALFPSSNRCGTATKSIHLGPNVLTGTPPHVYPPSRNNKKADTSFGVWLLYHL